MPNTDPENVTIRLPRNLIEQIREIAIANDRSLSAELRVALREHVRREAAK